MRENSQGAGYEEKPFEPACEPGDIITVDAWGTFTKAEVISKRWVEPAPGIGDWFVKVKFLEDVTIPATLEHAEDGISKGRVLEIPRHRARVEDV